MPTHELTVKRRRRMAYGECSCGWTTEVGPIRRGSAAALVRLAHMEHKAKTS